MNEQVVIAFDTSNYTTSAAAADRNGNIVSDHRILLKVREGERGLRQQEALFQHVNGLPEVVSKVMDDIHGCTIAAAACSVRPRPVEGSYMPCFNAGWSEASVLASTLGVPLYEFSHQEGHVAAAEHGTELEGRNDYIFFHLSGGTTEAAELPGYEIAGRTLDISFGQLIDRTGVMLGISFPCGRTLDSLAMSYEGDGKYVLPKIKVRDGDVNLSGVEAACLRLITETEDSDQGTDRALLAKTLFDRTAEALADMTVSVSRKTGKKDFLFAGGVSSSIYIRNKLKELIPEGINVFFGEPELCRDNAAGIAILGGRKLWR
ncbi:MAG: hypothetical protein IKF54_01150 [Eubacterium sp.]|nr:hypothetical protein [Eubacterium sp.]